MYSWRIAFFIAKIFFACIVVIGLAAFVLWHSFADWMAGDRVHWEVVAALSLLGGGGLVGAILLVIAIFEEQR